jgi:undecaprenyl-diphosphatase
VSVGPAGKRRLRFALGLVVTLATLALAGAVLAGRCGWFDSPLIRQADSLRSPALTVVMRLVTDLGDGWMLAAVAVVTALVLLFVRRRRAAAFVAVTSIGASLMNAGLKAVVARPRPVVLAHLTPAGGFAFPSGHAMASAAIYGAVAIVIALRVPWLAVAVPLLAVVLVLGVGVSRVYLGVHYPSDVLVGWVLGVSWPIWLRSWAFEARPS